MPEWKRVPEWKRARFASATVEKRPGPDWVVEILVVEDDEIYPVSVFGAKDAAEAVRDALSSFALQPSSSDGLRVMSVTGLIPRKFRTGAGYAV